MQCPICSVELVMSERQGIEIDYCPKCRGVWLDRGELDKIIEKSASAIPGAKTAEYDMFLNNTTSRTISINIITGIIEKNPFWRNCLISRSLVKGNRAL